MRVCVCWRNGQVEGFGDGKLERELVWGDGELWTVLERSNSHSALCTVSIAVHEAVDN